MRWQRVMRLRCDAAKQRLGNNLRSALAVCADGSVCCRRWHRRTTPQSRARASRSWCPPRPTRAARKSDPPAAVARQSAYVIGRVRPASTLYLIAAATIEEVGGVGGGYPLIVRAAGGTSCVNPLAPPSQTTNDLTLTYSGKSDAWLLHAHHNCADKLRCGLVHSFRPKATGSSIMCGMRKVFARPPCHSSELG